MHIQHISGINVRNFNETLTNKVFSFEHLGPDKLDIRYHIYVITLLSDTGFQGAPVAQWVKRWPTDLAVPGSIPALGEKLSNCKWDSLAHSLSLSSYHCTDITEILLKRM